MFLFINSFVTVFTDASFCNKTNAFGWATWIKYGQENETFRLSGDGYVSSSVEAEKQAVWEAAKIVVEKGIISNKIIVMQTDCRAAIKDDSESVVQFLLSSGARKAYFKHVKGHRGKKDARSAVNTWCDHQAKKEMRLLRHSTRKEKEKRKEKKMEKTQPEPLTYQQLGKLFMLHTGITYTTVPLTRVVEWAAEHPQYVKHDKKKDLFFFVSK